MCLNGFVQFSAQLLNINLALDGHSTRVATCGEGFPKTEFPPQISFVTGIFFYSATPHTHILISTTWGVILKVNIISYYSRRHPPK